MLPVRMLLVDDEKDFIETLAQRLVGRGYQADYVLNGEEALRYLEKYKDEIDVVLLDLKMPGLDGVETLRRIKAMDPLIETIMLTAYGTIPKGVEAMRIGARDFLEKPCDLVQLTAKVEAAAKRKRERESKIWDVRTRPYITDREKEELIAAILNS